MPDYILRTHSDRQRVTEMLTQLAMDKPWRVSLTPYKSRRSSEQNDRFHKLIRLLAEETGEDPGRLKEWAKAEFGPMVIVEVGGASKTIPKPSHQYEVGEMSVVMERFEAWCVREMGLCLG